MELEEPAPPHAHPRLSRAQKAKANKLEQQAAAERCARETAARERAVDKGLLSNFFNARFRSSALVGSSATAWMQYVDAKGCTSAECLHLVHIYYVALDADPPEDFTPGAIARLDEDLISLQQEGCDLSVTAAQRSMAAIGPVGAEHWWWWFDPPCYVSGGCPLIPR